MYYVYMRTVETGKEDFVACYPDETDAIKRVCTAYKLDENTRSLGRYYYFIKKH